MTHRDLGHVLPSVCALKHALGGPLTTGLDLPALGRHETDLWSRSLRTTIDFRDDGNEDRFFDVSFDDVQHDPIAAMERLYAAMGDELTADTRARMIRWWDESAGDRRVGPRPDPSAYGLDGDSVRAEFAFYHDRFGLR
jgi:hypothetical protein